MIDGIPNRPLYLYQQDIIDLDILGPFPSISRFKTKHMASILVHGQTTGTASVQKSWKHTWIPSLGSDVTWNGELSFFGLVKHEVKTENVDKNGYFMDVYGRYIMNYHDKSWYFHISILNWIYILTKVPGVEPVLIFFRSLVRLFILARAVVEPSAKAHW